MKTGLVSCPKAQSAALDTGTKAVSLLLLAAVLAPASALAQVSLGDAVDATNLVWTSGGNAVWLRQTSVTHDGVDAAQSGTIFDSQESWLQTTVTGPGLVAFWWKVSSELDYDFLEFTSGGVRRARISGEEDWRQVAVEVPAGNQTLRWRYSKDSLTALGQDRGWLDEVAYRPHSGPPIILAQPADRTSGLNNTVTFRVGAAGAPPLRYQWARVGAGPIEKATNAALVLANVQTADAGDYRVSVSNTLGVVTSDAGALSVTTNGTIETILLFVDNSTTGPYELALVNLGRSFQRFSVPSTFNQAVAAADPRDRLLVVDPVVGNHSFNPVARFAESGGRVLIQYWSLDVGSDFATAFDATIIEMLSTALPLHDWGGSPFFEGVAVTPGRQRRSTRASSLAMRGGRFSTDWLRRAPPPARSALSRINCAGCWR